MASVQAPGVEAPSQRSKWVRKPPPLPAQLIIGGWVYGVAAPLVWTLQKAGLAEKVLGGMFSGMQRGLAKNNPFAGYTPGKQDVFVMTLPKSGTNWMMQIAHQLIWHGASEYDHIHELVPWPDTMAMPGFMRRYAIPLEQADHWKSSPEQKRVIKTHFDWEMLPYSEDARYIAVIRDPKDAFVSSYFFVKDIYGPAMPTLDTWYRMFLAGRGMMGMSWPTNAAGYWAQRHRPNVLIVSFKSMKRDLKGSVRKVAEFLDIAASEDLVQKVTAMSSFDYMKNIDHKFGMVKIIIGREAGSMIRKGAQGGSSELLTPEQQRAIDAYCIAELKRMKCDLPYEEFADPAR